MKIKLKEVYPIHTFKVKVNEFFLFLAEDGKLLQHLLSNVVI